MYLKVSFPSFALIGYCLRILLRILIYKKDLHWTGFVVLEEIFQYISKFKYDLMLLPRLNPRGHAWTNTNYMTSHVLSDHEENISFFTNTSNLDFALFLRNYFFSILHIISSFISCYCPTLHPVVTPYINLNLYFLYRGAYALNKSEYTSPLYLMMGHDVI